MSAAAANASAAEIIVMSGGAPKEVFLELTPQFEKQTGHKVRYVFAVMSALRDKVAAGEKADVFVMPTNILDGYQKDGKVAAGQRTVLGLVSINAVVKKGAPKPDLSTPEKTKESILKARSIAHASPGATPSGTHMGQLIEKLGIAEQMKAKTIHRPALEGGVQLVASGEAEIGFYPKSEVIADNLDIAGPLPPAIQLTTIYGAAVTTASHWPNAGAAFIAFMTDPKNRLTWTRGGFDPPPQ